MAKVTGHELAKNLTTYFGDGPNANKTITQEELINLFNDGSIDQTQAFLIYELFHDRIVEH